MKRLLVFGGRFFKDISTVYDVLDRAYAMQPDVEIISGMAPGVDMFAYEWAKDRNVPCLKFPADWKKHGRAAGPIRNQQMLDEGQPDFAVAFPGGDGTNDMFNRLTKAGVLVLDLRNRYEYTAAG